jgi:cytochrome c-type biogenesis protein CcmH
MLLFILPGNFVALAAQYDAFVFDTPEQEKAFHRLSGELRCLVCQNQSISDSNAGLAKDLRTEIHDMLLEGKSEDEIISFMVERYGDYVLYRPPFKPLTWLLWIGPLIIFVMGLFFVKRFVREHSANNAPGELSDAEVERIRNLQSEIETLHDRDANKGGDDKDKAKQGETSK